VGPLNVRLRLAPGIAGRNVQYLVAGGSRLAAVRNGWAEFEVRSVLAHEVVVLE
jgi:hypothetical protein